MLQVQQKPLRVHEPLLSDDVVAEAVRAGDADRNAVESKMGLGYAFGDAKRDIIIGPDGNPRGRSEEEPDNDAIDTGNSFDDLTLVRRSSPGGGTCGGEPQSSTRRKARGH